MIREKSEKSNHKNAESDKMTDNEENNNTTGNENSGNKIDSGTNETKKGDNEEDINMDDSDPEVLKPAAIEKQNQIDMTDTTSETAIPGSLIQQVNVMEQQLNEGTDQGRENGPESVIPEELRNNDCPNGIIAQGRNFTVIQNHGNSSGANENIYYQFRLTMQTKANIPSLATNEDKVALGDSVKQKHHALMKELVPFCGKARKSSHMKVRILTAK